MSPFGLEKIGDEGAIESGLSGQQFKSEEQELFAGVDSIEDPDKRRVVGSMLKVFQEFTEKAI